MTNKKVAETFFIKIKDNFSFGKLRELKLFLIKYVSDNTFKITSFDEKWVQF